jgi:hypothetical protein
MKAVRSRPSQHLHIKNILVTKQYSFKNGIIEDTACSLKSVFKSINQKNACWRNFYVIWQRLLIACVNHEILLAKLHSSGIRRVSEYWFRSCLTNGRQKVEVKSVKSPNSAQTFNSDKGIVKHRIPWGSILGSILFIIYITGLPLRINSMSKPILFADGTSVLNFKQKFWRFLFIVKFSSLSHD